MSRYREVFYNTNILENILDYLGAGDLVNFSYVNREYRNRGLFAKFFKDRIYKLIIKVGKHPLILMY